MKAFIYIALSALVSLVPAEHVHQRRANSTVIRPLGQIFAYGADIAGLPLFVADGTAYLGNVSLSPISGASNLSFTAVGSEFAVHHQLTNSSGTHTTLQNETYLAIDPSSGASEPVLLVAPSDKANYTTDGFYTYGTQITWIDPDEVIEANFCAEATDVDGVWALEWNADGVNSVGGTLVVLKAVPPPFS